LKIAFGSDDNVTVIANDNYDPLITDTIHGTMVRK